jgi:hypothetical protein
MLFYISFLQKKQLLNQNSELRVQLESEESQKQEAVSTATRQERYQNNQKKNYAL